MDSDPQPPEKECYRWYGFPSKFEKPTLIKPEKPTLFKDKPTLIKEKPTLVKPAGVLPTLIVVVGF